MKKFEIPQYFRSGFISKLKSERKAGDPRKESFLPTSLDFGNVRFYLARHFGFCYGVENAIEIAYKALHENEGKKIYLLSQMIHNPEVNADLEANGIHFILDTGGKQLINWDTISANDIVVIPAFGTTIEMQKFLEAKGIQTEKYNTTCPFVERVWNRAEKLGKSNYTIIIHGKEKHEETRATFSHSKINAPSIIVRDMNESVRLGKYILGELPIKEFYKEFEGKFSEGFDALKDLQQIGVINQTTMLATETQAIADYFKYVMRLKYGNNEITNHFADTRDTLCYATNDNQDATIAMLEVDADLAIVVGGYNSSNTSHLVELLERKFPTYFIKNDTELVSRNEINHFIYNEKKLIQTKNYLPVKPRVNIVLSSGASCPDSVIERVMIKILGYFGKTLNDLN